MTEAVIIWKDWFPYDNGLRHENVKRDDWPNLANSRESNCSIMIYDFYFLTRNIARASQTFKTDHVVKLRK